MKALPTPSPKAPFLLRAAASDEPYAAIWSSQYVGQVLTRMGSVMVDIQAIQDAVDYGASVRSLYANFGQLSQHQQRAAGAIAKRGKYQKQSSAALSAARPLWAVSRSRWVDLWRCRSLRLHAVLVVHQSTP